MASLKSGCDKFCEYVYARGLSMHKKCSNHALTNLLFKLCRSVWIIDSFAIRLNPHPEAPTRPSTFEGLRAREHTLTPFFFIVRTHIWVFQGVWGCINMHVNWKFVVIVMWNNFARKSIYTKRVYCVKRAEKFLEESSYIQGNVCQFNDDLHNPNFCIHQTNYLKYT